MRRQLSLCYRCHCVSYTLKGKICGKCREYKIPPLKRRYVYEDTYNKIMNWAKENNIKAPNAKRNFPYYLDQYIKSKE